MVCRSAGRPVCRSTADAFDQLPADRL